MLKTTVIRLTEEVSDRLEQKAAETGITGIDLPDYETVDQVDRFFETVKKVFG